MARGAAWSIPVIALAAHAPAMAASAAVASVDARCHGTRGNGGIVAIRIATLPADAQVAIRVSHSGSGGYRSEPDFTPTTTTANPDGATTYVVAGVGAPFSGEIDLTFILGRNETGTVVVSVATVAGVTLTGDLLGTVTVRREGNSNNYTCGAL